MYVLCRQEKNTWMIDCGCKQDKRIASKTLEYVIIFLYIHSFVIPLLAVHAASWRLYFIDSSYLVATYCKLRQERSQHCFLHCFVCRVLATMALQLRYSLLSLHEQVDDNLLNVTWQQFQPWTPTNHDPSVVAVECVWWRLQRSNPSCRQSSLLHTISFEPENVSTFYHTSLYLNTVTFDILSTTWIANK
jgi:hypothetical protein